MIASRFRSSAPRMNRKARPLALKVMGLLLVPLLCAACGARSDDRMSTDTGNPPVIDQAKIRVRASDAGVVVWADAGAVSPAGAMVAVTNVTTAETVTTTAKNDGSFEVELAGAVTDEYRVEVRADDRKASVDAVVGEADATFGIELQCFDASAEPPQGTTTGPAGCSLLWAEAMCLAEEVLDVDTTCESDADCVKVSKGLDCVDSCHGTTLVSASEAAGARSSLDAINNEVCAAFKAQGCNYIASGCPPLSPWHAGCVEGTCQAVRGCEEGQQAAAATIAAEATALAEGCDADADCTVVFAPSCDWQCTDEVLFVAEGELERLQTLRETVDATCKDALVDESCGQASCTTAEPSEQAVCSAGVCVDARSASAVQCVWGVDELLAHVGAIVSERQDCGLTNGSFGAGVEELFRCFEQAPAAPGAEFTLNNCVDCQIPSTYVSTPDGQFYHVRMEADLFGDDRREASVHRCSDVALTTTDTIVTVECVNAEELYACTDSAL